MQYFVLILLLIQLILLLS